MVPVTDDIIGLRTDIIRAFDVPPSSVGVDDVPLESEIRLGWQRRAGMKANRRAPGDLIVEVERITQAG